MRRRLEARRRAAHRYLAQPMVVTRRTVFGIAVAFGLLAGVGVVLGGIAVTGLADERSSRSEVARQALRRDLESKVASARAEASAAQRLARLERPTDADLARAIRHSIRALRSNPRLQREVRRSLEATFGASSTSSPASPSVTSPAPSRPPARRPSSSSSTAPGGATRPSTPAPPAQGGQPPAAAPPPPASTSPGVNVPTPSTIPQPTVCLPAGLGGVNCPPGH